MTLLMYQVADNIHLMGRWWSDTMLRYLHMTANIFTEGLLGKMSKHGAYELIPLACAGNSDKQHSRSIKAPSPRGF